SKTGLLRSIGRALIVFGCAGSLLGQTTLALQSGSASPGGTVSLNLILTTSTATMPAALQWSLGYSSADITAVNITAGPSATAAGKTLTCANTASSNTCTLAGLNLNTLTTGVVAVAQFTVAPQITVDSQVQVGAAAGATLDGNALGVTTGNGVI